MNGGSEPGAIEMPSTSIRSVDRRLFGDLLDVRPEQDAGNRGGERAVRPVVEVPGLLLLGPVQRPQVGNAVWADRVARSPLIGVPPLSPLEEHILEHVGAISEQPVDPTVEEFPHLLGVVDRPDVDVLAGRVRPTDQGARRDQDSSAAMRHLERGDSTPGEPVGEASARKQQEAQHLGRCGRGRDAAARSAAGTPDPTLRERADQDPVPGLPRLDEAGQHRDRPSDLMSMLNRASGNSSKSSPERRDLLAAADQRLPDLGVGRAAAISPCRSVTRSSTASWKASR